MEFVEQYLALPSVWTFEDKEQNLLTYEVIMTSYVDDDDDDVVTY